jgi:pilus assembly protein CpaB
MKLSTLILLATALFFGVAAALVARQILMARPASPQNTIVIAAQPLSFGTELSDDNVAEVSWPSSVIPDGAFVSKEALFKDGRRVALIPVERNEPVLSSRITGAGEKGDLSALIGAGMRAVTVRVDDVRGVAGFVTPGDRVDIVLTRNQQTGEQKNSYADVLLQNVKVLGVDQIASPNQEKASVAKAVTVEVTTEQAQKLVLAQGVGTLSLVLRKAGLAASEPTRRVTMVDLGESEVAGPVAEKRPPPAVSSTATVRVFRAGKAAEYSVYRQTGVPSALAVARRHADPTKTDSLRLHRAEERSASAAP